MTSRHRAAQGAPRKRVLRWYATGLAVAGVVLIGVASCSSSTPPPQPSAEAAGTIDATATVLSSSVSSSAAPSSSDPSSATPSSSAGSSAAASSRTSIPTTSAGTPKVPASASKPPATTSSKAPATKAAATKAAATTAPAAKKSIVVPSFDPVAVKGPILSQSKPVSIQIPSLKVDSPTSDLKLLADKTIEVPPLEDTNATGWYDGSPTPGELGPSVILGHVDSAKSGPSVFYKLGTMKPGDEVDVTRADGSVAVFKVDGVRSYGKNEFPSEVVYGNLDHAGLRLITCGGTFDPNVGHYESNIVAFASLVSSR